MIQKDVTNTSGTDSPRNQLSAQPPLMDLGAFGYFFEDGRHLWAYKERNWWFNQLRLDEKILSGDVGDWRSGRSIAFGLQEVVQGKADQEILCHFNPKVLAHIKAVAANLLEGLSGGREHKVLPH